MAEAPDPFGDAIVDETPRDRYGRPKLISLRDDVPKDKEGRTAYTRASTLASYIENDTHITRWKMRYLARGIAWNPDLSAMAGMETYNTRIGMPDKDPENSASGKRLDKIIDQALDRMFISEKADYGTVIHAATEPDYEGFIQDRMKADVDSFNAKLLECGIKIVGTELFTANDVTMSAGTFDHLMWVPGYGFVVTDKKTSAKVDGPHFAIQVSSYSYAELYDIKTDTRTPLESLTGGEEVNRKVGLIFWIKNGKTESSTSSSAGKVPRSRPASGTTTRRSIPARSTTRSRRRPTRPVRRSSRRSTRSARRGPYGPCIPATSTSGCPNTRRPPSGASRNWRRADEQTEPTRRSQGA
jgi:hypothetical protein